MRNSTQPTLETIQQFRDHAGHLWCAQLYYPNGKAKGNDRYWIGTLSCIPTGESLACHSLMQLDYEVGKRRQATLDLR